MSLMVPVLSRGWMRLTCLHLLESLANQGFSYATDFLHQTGRENIAFIALIALTQLVFTLFWSAAWILAITEVAQSIISRSRLEIFAIGFIKYFNQLVIEQIRAMASILWRVPILLVPALIQYVRMTFVPFIVILDPQYEAGKVDALKASSKVSRGHFWFLAALLLVSIIAPWLAEQSAQAGGSEFIWQNPIGVGIGWILTLLINCFASLFLFLVFQGIFFPPPKDAGDETQTASVPIS